MPSGCLCARVAVQAFTSSATTTSGGLPVAHRTAATAAVGATAVGATAVGATTRGPSFPFWCQLPSVRNPGGHRGALEHGRGSALAKQPCRQWAAGAVCCCCKIHGTRSSGGAAVCNFATTTLRFLAHQLVVAIFRPQYDPHLRRCVEPGPMQAPILGCKDFLIVNQYAFLPSKPAVLKLNLCLSRFPR